MNPFYKLNQTLTNISKEHNQITESVAKAAAEVKTPARITLEESLKQDMKALMEDATGGASMSNTLETKTKSYSAKNAAAGKDIGKPGKNFEKIAKSAGKKYGSKAAGERVAGAVLNKLRAAKESVEEASMEMEAGAGGIHGTMPDPMTAKDQQKKMNPPRSLEEKDQDEDQDEDIIAYLNRKLAPHDKQQAKEDSCATPYNTGSGRPDAHNGMEFEGNAFTGKLASTPKGGTFELDGEEHTDTSSLEEQVSRKHFQQVADLLKNIPDEAKRKELAMHHAHIFSQQNPRFDMRRFGQACGVDLEECAMWEELKGGQKKLDKNHNGSLDANDFAMLRGDHEVDEGYADMDRWLAQREKEKGTGRFDSRKVSTGTVYTRKPETFAGDDEEGSEPAIKRGRGRPAVAKKPERVTGKAWKHKGGRVQEEEQEVDEEKQEAGKRHFFDKLAPAAKKVAKVVSKVTAGKEEKKQAPKKDSKPAEKKSEKKQAPKKSEKKEEKVEETTTSGSVSPTSTGKKSNSMGIGQGIYDSIERDFERLLNEAVTVKQESMMDEHIADGDVDSITITATGDDVARLKQALQAMGVSHGADDHTHAEPHGEEPCHSCGGVPCQCDELGAEVVDLGLPGEIEFEINEGELNIGDRVKCPNGIVGEIIADEGDRWVVIDAHSEFEDDQLEFRKSDCKPMRGIREADAPVTQNSPDYPTNQECSDDALQYSGGLNGKKSTGQTTVPVLASQEERQLSEGKSFLDLYKAFAKIK